MKKVENNDKVKVHYTGSLPNGEVFDSSEGREPLEFTVGQGMVIPGFEEAVVGMAIDEEKNVEIPSNLAYGPVNDEMIFDVTRNELPADLEIAEGMELVSKQPDGSQVVFRVKKIDGDQVKLDANHPLAGEDLHFKVKLVEIS